VSSGGGGGRLSLDICSSFSRSQLKPANAARFHPASSIRLRASRGERAGCACELCRRSRVVSASSLGAIKNAWHVGATAPASRHSRRSVCFSADGGETPPLQEDWCTKRASAIDGLPHAGPAPTGGYAPRKTRKHSNFRR
jgi:hypothetical protein